MLGIFTISDKMFVFPKRYYKFDNIGTPTDDGNTKTI